MLSSLLCFLTFRHSVIPTRYITCTVYNAENPNVLTVKYYLSINSSNCFVNKQCLIYLLSGCIAAGFTRCCAFGACRVDLPDGGHCFCDRECFTYPHHNCCSDNPCDGKIL